MKGLRYTLIGDGTSDKLLLHPIRWALRRLNVTIEREQWADLTWASPKPKTLSDRARAAIELFPADLLFIHRDAETEPRTRRVAEISAAMAGLLQRHVPIVPVRMTEAWFLHDEKAIRRASGNPNGTIELAIPPGSESIVDPKRVLRDALLVAANLNGRRRDAKAREFPQMRARAAELVEDYGPIEGLSSFKAFLVDLKNAIDERESNPTS